MPETNESTTLREPRRAHVVLPPDLLAQVDRLVGPRRRSQFFAEAAVEKLARIKLAESAARVAGSLAGICTPNWESSEAAASWVRSTRQANDAKRAARARV